jgi:glycerol dehydrogenase
MTQMFASPGRYIQGYKELERLPKHVAWFGDSFLVVTSKGRKEDLQKVLDAGFAAAGKRLEYAIFGGEVTKKEIQRIVEIMKAKKCHGVLGIGGGKVLDTAKAVAYYSKAPICIVPTIASNDAPTSSLSVVYREDGAFDDVLFYEKSPDVVLIDTFIVAQAPTRLLVAGMGDALATYFEARTCVEAYRDNFLGSAGGGMGEGERGSKPTVTSMAIAELCYRVLLEDGVQAKLSCDRKCVTKAFNRVVEANSLMSGIGFESNGVATAHAVYCGFSELKGRQHMYHGEYVAFGTIVMLLLEGKPSESIDAVVRFCMSVGLPVTFADLGLADIRPEEIALVVKTAASPTQTSNVEPFKVTEEEMKAALLLANEVGQLYKSGGSLLSAGGLK